MRIRNLTYELKRPVALALASVAVVAVLIAVVLAWQQAEESHDLRRRARLLMMSEATARHELEQMRQTAGALAALTARTTAQQQELSRLESARGQAQGQLAEAQQDLVAQQAARSELAKMIEADVRRAGEMRAQQEQVSAGLNTLREENAGLERRVAESKRELEATQGQLAKVQQELLAQQTARSALANVMEADARRAGEMRVQQEQVTAGLNTLREESAGLERRLAESKRELDDTQGQLAKVQQDLVAQQAERSEFAKMMEADSRRAGECGRSKSR
jgi:chromosome segregation ATPase